jgi:hypothetical protein
MLRRPATRGDPMMTKMLVIALISFLLVIGIWADSIED